MNDQHWFSEVKALPVGKKLPKAVYVHRLALKDAAPALYTFVAEKAVAAGLPDAEGAWNIVRLHKDCFKVTLLDYPDFHEEAYPALRFSTGIDLASEQVKNTDFSRSANPPILHRKETMILASDECYDDFCEITREGEVEWL